jgi:hypothetical protein
MGLGAPRRQSSGKLVNEVDKTYLSSWTQQRYQVARRCVLCLSVIAEAHSHTCKGT